MKKYFFLILFVFLQVFLFSQELQFKVVERCKYVPLGNLRQISYLEEGSIVTCNNYISYSQALTDDFTFSLSIILLKGDGKYLVEAEKLIPLDAHDTFSPHIAINHSKENNELWVPSYYANTLSSRERDTLINFEPLWLPWEVVDDRTGNIETWYMLYELNYDGEVMFYNAAIRLTLTDTCLMVKDIQKTDYGYQVVCMRAKQDIGRDAGSHFNWSYVKDDEYFSLLMVEDGEYLDLYVDNFSQKFGSLIKVRQEFAKQFESLIKTNTCDLTNVQWPKRADGSMGPPKETPNITLTPKIIEESDTGADTEDPQTIQNNARTGAVPFWARLAIIGGAVAVAGGAAVFVIKRKKS
jgi:hypothetical protein